MTLKLRKASQYSIEALTTAYNRSRKAYLVPMQMAPAELVAYIQHYDVDLAHSLVAELDGEIAGLIMLGVRPNRSWVTRLGVNHEARGNGVGRMLAKALLAESDQLGIPLNILEVIVGNDPAYHLFRQIGFEPVRQLLILERPAGDPAPEVNPVIHPLSREEVLTRLANRPRRQAWTNETETYTHVDALFGFRLRAENGEEAWLAYEAAEGKLSRLTYQLPDINPAHTLTLLLRHLHHQHPTLKTYTENIPADDPALPAFSALGYTEAFRRNEMLRQAEGSA